jgi:hypothetical protein
MHLSGRMVISQELAGDDGHGILHVVDMSDVKVGIDVVRKGLITHLK